MSTMTNFGLQSLNAILAVKDFPKLFKILQLFFYAWLILVFYKLNSNEQKSDLGSKESKAKPELEDVARNTILLATYLGCYEGYIGIPDVLLQVSETCETWLNEIPQRNVTGCYDTCVLVQYSLYKEGAAKIRDDAIMRIIKLQFNQSSHRNSIDLLLSLAYSCKDHLPKNISKTFDRMCFGYSPFWKCLESVWSRKCPTRSKRSITTLDENETKYESAESEHDQKQIDGSKMTGVPSQYTNSPFFPSYTTQLPLKHESDEFSVDVYMPPPSPDKQVNFNIDSKRYKFSGKIDVEGEADSYVDFREPHTNLMVPEKLDTSTPISSNNGYLRSVHKTDAKSKDAKETSSQSYKRSGNLLKENTKNNSPPGNKDTTNEATTYETNKYTSTAPSNQQTFARTNFNRKVATADNAHVEDWQEKPIKDSHELDQIMSQIEPAYRKLHKRRAEIVSHQNKKDNLFSDEISNGASYPNIAYNVHSSSGKTGFTIQSFGRQHVPAWYMRVRRRRQFTQASDDDLTEIIQNHHAKRQIRF